MPKGSRVYTCPLCGREGESSFMGEHLKDAHGIKSARERSEIMKYYPSRYESTGIHENIRRRMGSQDPFPNMMESL